MIIMKKKHEEDFYHVSYDNYLDTNACTECTGLMPNIAEDRQEWDAYREIFDFTAKPPRSREEPT